MFNCCADRVQCFTEGKVEEKEGRLQDQDMDFRKKIGEKVWKRGGGGTQKLHRGRTRVAKTAAALLQLSNCQLSIRWTKLHIPPRLWGETVIAADF